MKMQYSSSTSKVFLKTESHKFKGKMTIGIGVQIFPKSIAMDYEGHTEDRRKGFIYYSGGELGQTHHTDSTFFWRQNMERIKHLSIQCSIFSSNAMLWKDFPPEAKKRYWKNRWYLNNCLTLSYPALLDLVWPREAGGGARQWGHICPPPGAK